MRAIAAIVLIIGLLKFAQEAPDLLKKIFNFGGDLLTGMDLNPRGQLKRQAEPAIHGAGRVGSAVAGGIGGAAAGAARARANANDDFKANGGKEGAHIRRGIHRGLSTLGGGVRGMIRGGANGFRNSSDSLNPRDMYGQLMSGTKEGHAAAQRQSQSYREGGSTNLFKRALTKAGKRVTEFGTDHIIDPATGFARSVASNATSNEATKIFENIKANNANAMTVTGTNGDVEKLKAAKDSAIAKVREAQAAGSDINEIKKDLKIKDDNNEIKTYGDLVKKINDNFKTQKQELLGSKFNDSDPNKRMSDDSVKLISQWNKDTIDNFKNNASLLSKNDLNTVLKAMTKEMNLQADLDSDGNIKDLTSALNSVTNKLENMNKAGNAQEIEQMRQTGAELMKHLDTLQGQMNNVNTNINNKQALADARKPAQPAPDAGGKKESGGSK